MNGATDSEMQLFQTLANPQRVDMNQQQKPPAPPQQSFHPNLVAVQETDFVASEKSEGSRKRYREEGHSEHPPPSAFSRRRRAPESEDGGASVYSQTKKGRAEKVGFLMELKKLRMQGCHLTREYSTKDRLEDIKYEYERQKMNLDCINSVALMSDGLKLGLSGIEMANNKLGPFLHLHGWSESVTQDMSRYNHVLERIYRKYWRQGSLNPLVELGMILVGSMMMFHFQNKFLGPTQQPPPAAPSKDTPIDRNVPRRAKRPTMRRPNTPMMPAAQVQPQQQPPRPLFSNLNDVPEIREVEERAPRTRRETAMPERVEEEQPVVVPAYEEEDARQQQQEETKIGDALDIDL